MTRPASPPRPRPSCVAPAVAAFALLLCAGCGGPPPLVLLPRPIPIGHDAAEVNDVALIDIDGDGRHELIAATTTGLHYLIGVSSGWSDETPGTALDRVGPSQRVVPDGLDLLVVREGERLRLAWSGIGSWAAPKADGDDAVPDQVVSVDVDLDGDGALDRAWIEGRTVRVALRDLTGVLREVTTEVASDALPLQGGGRCLIAGDVDGDGDVDLVAVGGRLMALINNGGALEPDAAR